MHCPPAVHAGGPDRRGVGEGGGRPASVKASLSVAFGQRAPNRAGAREQGRGMGAELQGACTSGASPQLGLDWWEGMHGGCRGATQLPANAVLPPLAPAVGKASTREERPRDRSKDERREERREDAKRHSRSRSRERYDRDRRRDDRWARVLPCCPGLHGAGGGLLGVVRDAQVDSAKWAVLPVQAVSSPS